MKKRHFAGIGLLSGVVSGAVAWSALQHTYRRDLFHKRAFRRWAALGHLSARPSMASVHMLREYIAWEPRPMLRTRAKHVLQDMERTLV